ERRYADTRSEELAGKHRATGARYRAEQQDLAAWWPSQMIGSRAPLREMLTLFWHGHFCSGYGKVRVSQAMYTQNAVLRKHALGNFRDLLEAVCLEPAMMVYL